MPTFINPAPLVDPMPRPHWDYFNAPGRDGYNPNYQNPGDPVGHKGLDIGALQGSACVAAHDGVVHYAGFANTAAGYTVEIISDGKVDGYYWGTRYLHLNTTPSVGKGDRVSRGQRIGSVGRTGNANYSHVHFEIKRLTTYSATQEIRVQGVPLDPMSFNIFAPPLSDRITRVEGSNRYATAAREARLRFPSGADIAYVALEGSPDAIIAQGAALTDGVPFLYVATDSLPAATAAAISDLGLQRIRIYGGPAAVSDGVAFDMDAIVGGQ
jgi:hypothetical protein